MKKQSILFLAGALLCLASCQSNMSETNNQEQIDSAVNARVEEIRLEMMMQNDSIINSLAQLRADSIIAAMKGGNTVTTKTTTNRTTTVKSTTPTPKQPSTPTSPTATGTKGDEKATGTKGNEHATGVK
jgi:hypothetical protein